jgi:DNA polymerase III gamma/tau subunit
MGKSSWILERRSSKGWTQYICSCRKVGLPILYFLFSCFSSSPPLNSLSLFSDSSVHALLEVGEVFLETILREAERIAKERHRRTLYDRPLQKLQQKKKHLKDKGSREKEEEGRKRRKEPLVSTGSEPKRMRLSEEEEKEQEQEKEKNNDKEKEGEEQFSKKEKQDVEEKETDKETDENDTEEVEKDKKERKEKRKRKEKGKGKEEKKVMRKRKDDNLSNSESDDESSADEESEVQEDEDEDEDDEEVLIIAEDIFEAAKVHNLHRILSFQYISQLLANRVYSYLDYNPRREGKQDIEKEETKRGRRKANGFWTMNDLFSESED